MSSTTQQVQEQLQAQANQAKAINGMKVGLEFLMDDSVIGPIKYAEGLADLKWMLRGMLSGQFRLDFNLNQGLSVVTGKPLSDYDGEDKPEEAKAE